MSLLVCMSLYVFSFTFPSSKYQNQTKKIITYINATYIINITQISEQTWPQFLTSASPTFLTFFQKIVQIWVSLNIFGHLKKIRMLLLKWLHSSIITPYELLSYNLFVSTNCKGQGFLSLYRNGTELLLGFLATILL